MSKYSIDLLRGVAYSLPEADAELVRSAASRLYMFQRAQDTDVQKEEQLQAIGESAAESIAEMAAALECDYERLAELRERPDDGTDATMEDAEREELHDLTVAAGDCEDRDQAEQRIQEGALSVEVRGDWYAPGGEGPEPPAEYRILLSTGGPATRIVGDLDRYGQPESARLQAQDWFTPWTDYRGDKISEAELLTYARQFLF